MLTLKRVGLSPVLSTVSYLCRRRRSWVRKWQNQDQKERNPDSWKENFCRFKNMWENFFLHLISYLHSRVILVFFIVYGAWKAQIPRICSGFLQGSHRACRNTTRNKLLQFKYIPTCYYCFRLAHTWNIHAIYYVVHAYNKYIYIYVCACLTNGAHTHTHTHIRYTHLMLTVFFLLI